MVDCWLMITARLDRVRGQIGVIEMTPAPGDDGAARPSE